MYDLVFLVHDILTYVFALSDVWDLEYHNIFFKIQVLL